jgi:hypothetical protein
MTTSNELTNTNAVKDGIAALVRLLMEQQSLTEQIKEVKTMIKTGGGKPNVAAKVAKAIVDSKVSELEEVSSTTDHYIEIARS